MCIIWVNFIKQLQYCSLQQQFYFIYHHQYQNMENFDAKVRTKHSTQRTVLKSSQLSQDVRSRFTSHQSSRRSKIPQPKQQVTSWNFLQARKQSQLNTLFNIRKHKLDQITKANYLIYQRINTQESYYPTKLLCANNNPKQCSSRFHTVEQKIDQDPQDQQQRKILGPIGNFKGLSTPILTQKQPLRKKSKKIKSSKPISLAKINYKKLEEIGNQRSQRGLPSIFHFY